MRSILFLMILAVVTSCKSGTDKNNEPDTSNEIELSDENTPDTTDSNFIDLGEDMKLRLRTFDNTTGIVRLYLDDHNDYGCRVNLLNDDGTNWMELDSKNDYKADNKDFAPWEFEPGYDLLLFRCVNETKDGYTVIVNEKQNLRKSLKKSNCMKFEPWNEHILSGFIEFDRKTNPVRNSPEDNAEIITPDPDIEGFTGLEVKGDWLKIGDALSETSQPIGWVKWKKDNQFLVYQFYLW